MLEIEIGSTWSYCLEKSLWNYRKTDYINKMGNVVGENTHLNCTLRWKLQLYKVKLIVMLSTVQYTWGNTSRLSGLDPRTDSMPTFFNTYHFSQLTRWLNINHHRARTWINSIHPVPFLRTVYFFNILLISFSVFQVGTFFEDFLPNVWINFMYLSSERLLQLIHPPLISLL